MKCLDYNFDPVCPKCGDNLNVERIVNTLNLLCTTCKVKFHIIEDTYSSNLWAKDGRIED